MRFTGRRLHLSPLSLQFRRQCSAPLVTRLPLRLRLLRIRHTGRTGASVYAYVARLHFATAFIAARAHSREHAEALMRRYRARSRARQ